MESAPTGFAVLYRWRLKHGMEEQFCAAWSRISEILLAHGSHGARLHRSVEDVWYAYAQWPDAQTRERATEFTEHLPECAMMREAIADSMPPILLEPVIDHLVKCGER